MRKSPGKVKTKLLECVETLRRWTTKQCFTHAFRPFSRGQSRLHLGIPLRKDVDSQPLPCSGEKPRARSTRLPSFLVVDRQDGADGSAVSDTGPVETAADHVETDPAVERRGRSQAQLQRLADFPWLGKESERRKRTSE